jgi:hypothetical protein
MSDNGSAALGESVRSVCLPLPPISLSPPVLISPPQAYLQRPRGAGERASSVPAHREDQSQGTKPAQWDPWGASLPPSRDLSGPRRNGTSFVSFLFSFSGDAYGFY